METKQAVPGPETGEHSQGLDTHTESYHFYQSFNLHRQDQYYGEAWDIHGYELIISYNEEA